MASIELRRFSAHCSNEGAHRSDFITPAHSFEEAALLFAERWREDSDACRVIVTDAESGEQHCFSIAMGEADPQPCRG